MRYEEFKQKTDKYKERLKELIESTDEIYDILSKIPEKEREWGQDRLKDFYDAVSRFLPEREKYMLTD
jgi:predicted nuclease with TOPRIM domain